MSPSQVVVSDTRSLIEKPALAVVERPDGLARTFGPDADTLRAARIREAAYALYEAHGRQDGHDVDDWLAAEAALAHEPAAAPSRSGDLAPAS